MHELAIAESIVNMAHETAAGRRVLRIVVEIGALSCVSPEALGFSFSLAAAGSSTEGAELDLRPVPGDGLNLKRLELERMADV
jgi:hydrogenase nickel incorporation protein HypA/HybF